MCLNAFPIKSRVSDTSIPFIINTDTTIDWYKHYKVYFGSYCELHEEHWPLNNINNEQTQSVICLGPTTNFQGRYTFLCLTKGKRITHKQFRVVPMSASVIIHVEELATIDEQTD